ncbi:MAG: hypothetical protein HYU86_12335 [Chloroflexi bacterium]|nr:hypothetical protein [Chloroflexota bacterium]
MTDLEEIASFFKQATLGDIGNSFYPTLVETELVNEADIESGEEEVLLADPVLAEAQQFAAPQRFVDLAAIDTGTILIGSTERGVIIAIKGAIIAQRGDCHSLTKLGPRLIYISKENEVAILESIGVGLGNRSMFIETDKEGVKSPKTPSASLKRIQDRIRNYIERKLQRLAVSQIESGIVLFDGALFAMEWDTPLPFLQSTRDLAFEKGNSIVGICKRSDLQVDGVNVAYLLRETQEPCFRRIEQNEQGIYSRGIGETFAARYGPGGFSFRTDVCPYIVTSAEILNRLYSSALMTLGYPVLLKLAHIHSVFTKREVVELQVLAARNYGLTLQRPQDISILFAPFRRAIQ